MTTGKTVTRLEYQAYTKLALKTMAEIIRDASHSVTRSEHQPPSQHDSARVTALIRCNVHHRIGTVPVGEPSIGGHRLRQTESPH